MKKPYLLFSTLLLLSANVLNAQALLKKNIIKVTPTAVAVGHYIVQYEQVINPRQSYAVSLGIAPNVGLPFKQTLLDLFDDNEQAVEAIETTKFNKITVTPEYRFYVGKKNAPAGFYVATFIRYTNMRANYTYKFTTSNNVDHYPNITTRFNGVGGGAMIGMQWLLGENFVLDWWIVGPFLGYMTGRSDGTDNMDDYEQEDKDNLKKDIESVKLPGWKQVATIGEGTIDVDLKGPFYGVRGMGLSIGWRF